MYCLNYNINYKIYNEQVPGALQEFIVEPIPTTLDLHERLVDAPAVIDGSYNIRWLEEHFLSKDD